MVFLGNAQMSANYVTGAKHNMALYRVQLLAGWKVGRPALSGTKLIPRKKRQKRFTVDR
jgi:hypothetical protein